MPGIQENPMSGDAPSVTVSIGIDQERKKICPKCRTEKTINDFHKANSRYDGLACYCKDCVSKDHKIIYINNKEKILKLGKIWHENNKEKHAKLGQRWRKENLTRARELGRKTSAKRRATPEGHAESIFYTRRWARNNPEKAKEAHKDYYKNNKERCDKLRRKSEVKRLYGLSDADYYSMIEQQNNKCYICGQSPKKNALAVDHDHQTGKIRKLLCSGCNHHVGIIEKGEDYLISLVRYLAEHESEMAINLLKKLEAT